MVAVGLSVSVFPNPASPLAIGAAVATRSALTPKSPVPLAGLTETCSVELSHPFLTMTNPSPTLDE